MRLLRLEQGDPRPEWGASPRRHHRYSRVEGTTEAINLGRACSNPYPRLAWPAEQCPTAPQWRLGAAGRNGWVGGRGLWLLGRLRPWALRPVRPWPIRAARCASRTVTTRPVRRSMRKPPSPQLSPSWACSTTSSRPIILYDRQATCRQPHVKGFVPHHNSIYNNWRYADVWLDK